MEPGCHVAEDHEADPTAAQLGHGAEVCGLNPERSIPAKQVPDPLSIDRGAPARNHGQIGVRRGQESRHGSHPGVYEGPFDPVHDLGMDSSAPGQLGLREAGAPACFANGTGRVHAG
jgi:hypothetical protein